MFLSLRGLPPSITATTTRRKLSSAIFAPSPQLPTPPQVNAVRPGFLGTQVAFGSRYCDPTPAFFGPGFPGSGGLEYRGAARSAELYAKLKDNVMVRAGPYRP